MKTKLEIIDMVNNLPPGSTELSNHYNVYINNVYRLYVAQLIIRTFSYFKFLDWMHRFELRRLHCIIVPMECLL